MHGILFRKAAVAEILTLRHAELRPGLPLESARFEGDTASGTRHYGAFSKDQNVGCVSFMQADWQGMPALQLRGMATRADCVRQGIGAGLLRFAVTDLKKRTIPEPLWCNARIEAIGFYRKMGWQPVGEIFVIEGVGPHVRMVFS